MLKTHMLTNMNMMMKCMQLFCLLIFCGMAIVSALQNLQHDFFFLTTIQNKSATSISNFHTKTLFDRHHQRFNTISSLKTKYSCYGSMLKKKNFVYEIFK